MTEIIYEKLVRDLIPEIIERSGKSCKTKTIEGPELVGALVEKLSEEGEEYLADRTVEELADILEVVLALMAHHGVSYEEVNRLRQSKLAKRGAFSNGTFLVSVTE